MNYIYNKVRNKDMIRLNLPTFEMKVSGTKQQPKILDVLRRKYVAITPEEWVRQHFVHYLIEHKGYPARLLANEIQLKCGDKVLRADSVLYQPRPPPQDDYRIQGAAYPHHPEGIRSDFGI